MGPIMYDMGPCITLNSRWSASWRVERSETRNQSVVGVKIFPVLFVILWTTNTIIPSGDFSSIVWHYLRDSLRSSLQGEIKLESLPDKLGGVWHGPYCLASRFGRETLVSLPSGGMYDIYNKTLIISWYGTLYDNGWRDGHESVRPVISLRYYIINVIFWYRK